MTQKLFPDFGSEGLREARLIYDKTPERSGDAMRLDTEKRGPGFAEAKKALRDAATTLNDPKIKEMLANEETLDMIASQVELLAGKDSKKWLNAIALSFLQKSHDIFTGEGQAINAAKDKSTDLAKKCAEILKATIDDLRKLQKAYKDAGGVGDFPGFDAELSGILTKKANVDTFKKRFDQLVDLMKDILWATDDEVNNAKKWTDKFKAVDIPEAKLNPYTIATEPTARRSALLKIVRETGGIELLNPDERKKVEAAMRAIDAKLSELQMNQQKLIADAFQERLRYLDRLGGTDQEALIHLSLERNGKFRLDALIQRLEILKKTKLTDGQKQKIEEALGLKTSVELTEASQVERIRKKYQIKDANEIKKLILAILKGGRDAVEADRAKSETELKKTTPSATVSIEDFSRDLLSLWNTGKAEEYLKSEGVKIDNPTGVSLSALALRARMPDTVVKMLEDGNYRPSPGVLISIAQMEQFGKKKKEALYGIPAATPKVDAIFEPKAGSAIGEGSVKIDSLKALVSEIMKRGMYAPSPEAVQRYLDSLVTKNVIKASSRAGYYDIEASAKLDLLKKEIGEIKVETDVDEAGFLGRESATAIVESVTEPTGSGTGFRLKNDGTLLLEYLTFLFFDGNGTEADRKAKEKLAEFKAAGGPLKQQADNSFLVDKFALIQLLGEFPVTAKPMDLYKQMRTAKVHEVTWKESVAFHASEFWKLAKAGGSMWWDYIAGIRKNFWDPEHDADLLTLLNQQAALKDGKASLEKLLKTSSGAQRFLETTETGLHSRREAQLKALRGDPAVSPSEHNVQAEALLMANQYVIGRLNVLGWNLCSRRLRQLTLWMAMHKGTKTDPEAGLKAALELLQEAKTLHTPEQQDTFVDEQMAEMNAADKKAFLRTIDARAIVETQAGRDILSPYKQRGLNFNPRALDLLRQAKDPANPALNLAAGVGRWIMDPPEKVRASLEIALEDSPAKAAFLEAFVTGEEQTYEYQGRTEKVSVIDARLAVNAFQQRLLFEMRGSIKAKEQIEDEDEFTNPVDRWLRTGIESMKDLWNTDMIGKAEVIAIAFAAYWMIKEAWKSKKGKFVLLGLPILLGVNAIVKQRTGRDLLGENLRFKNKEDRSSPLEAFRRRGAALDKRYAVLMQPSGQAAIRVLMNEKNPVAVQELLAWRNAVKSGGGKQFSLGAPKSLRVSDIEDNLGATGSREKACEVAYYAFEALCGDVARINGLAGGNTDTNAEQGADLIQRRYVANRATSLKPATMFEVIMSECQMPTKEMLENRSYLEAAADMFGYTYDEASALVKKYGVQAWVMMKQGVHKVPEMWEAGKGMVFASADSVWDWAKLTKTKLWAESKEDFAAGWKLIAQKCADAKIFFIQKTPEACEWMFDTTGRGVEGAREAAKSTYLMLLSNGVTGPVLNYFVESAKSALDLDLDTAFTLPAHVESLAKVSELQKSLTDQVSAFAEVPDTFGVLLEGWLKKLSGKTNFETEVTDPIERMLWFDLLKKQVFTYLVACRHVKLFEKRNDPNFKLTERLAVSWPTADQKFEDYVKTLPKETLDAYNYLLSHYNTNTVLQMPLMVGDERTFVGAMQAARKENTVVGWLSVISYVLPFRGRASEFLDPQVDAYRARFLSEAEKEFGGKDSEKYKQYETYLNALVTNVVLETILSAQKRPVDLELFKAQAKQMRLELYGRRGIAPSVDHVKKFPNLVKEFTPSAISPVPDTVAKAAEEAARAAAAPAAPSGPSAPPDRPRVAESEVDRLINPANTPNPADLVRALGGEGVVEGKRQELRKRFKEVVPAAPVFSADAGEREWAACVQYLLGVPEADAKTYGEVIVAAIIAGADDPAIVERRAGKLLKTFAKARETQGPVHAKRLQCLLDGSATGLLQKVVEQIPNIDKAERISKFEQSLLALYGLTIATPDQYTDLVSMALEFVLYGGKYKDAGGIDAYKEYLKGKGFTVPGDSLYSYNGRRMPGATMRMGRDISEAVFLGAITPRITALLKELENRSWMP
ncbi:MAG: hypothetical protein Q7S29_02405 [Candidatus Peribacter sp.]|nr:hypothetical protein [Candidatus Peribacter sp.]